MVKWGLEGRLIRCAFKTSDAVAGETGLRVTVLSNMFRHWQPKPVRVVLNTPHSSP